MTRDEYLRIAEAIWRSGYMEDKSKMRQLARKKMQRLIASNIATSLKVSDPCFDRVDFIHRCGLSGEGIA